MELDVKGQYWLILWAYLCQLRLLLQIFQTINRTADAAGILAVDLLKGKVPRLQKITADMGYKNTFQEHIEECYKWKVKMHKTPNLPKDLFHKKISLAGRKKPLRLLGLVG